MNDILDNINKLLNTTDIYICSKLNNDIKNIEKLISKACIHIKQIFLKIKDTEYFKKTILILNKFKKEICLLFIEDKLKKIIENLFIIKLINKFYKINKLIILKIYKKIYKTL